MISSDLSPYMELERRKCLIRIRTRMPKDFFFEGMDVLTTNNNEIIGFEFFSNLDTNTTFMIDGKTIIIGSGYNELRALRSAIKGLKAANPDGYYVSESMSIDLHMRGDSMLSMGCYAPGVLKR